MTLRAFRRPVTAAWAVLVLATLLTAWLAETSAGVTAVAVAIVLIASAKIAVVMSEFMELRRAPRQWWFALGGWLVVVTGVVLSGHLLG